MTTKTEAKPRKAKTKRAEKRAVVTKRSKKPTAKEAEENEADLSASYNKFKEFEGRRYTGMKIGRSHKWYYDQGVWKEKKITPDGWEINYAVTKRRAGKAPEGSGVPVGTEYHWYILAHQHVKKLDANAYSTAMSGLKFKLAHKRADAEKWSAGDVAQRRKLVKILKEMIAELEREPDEASPVTMNAEAATEPTEAVVHG